MIDAGTETQKVAFITGAARGIGLATTQRFLADGFKIVAFDLPNADFSQLQLLEKSSDGAVTSIGGDVSDEEDWKKALAVALSTYGRVDVLFNNAGISGPSLSPFKTALADFERVMQVNVTGVFLGIKVIGEHMKSLGGGVIINTSSISGERGGGNVLAYTTSKHAVNGMTKSAASSLAKHNIRVLAVCPSPTATEMVYAVERKIAPDNPESARDTLAAGIPMKRYGEPLEIANVVAFLASDQASYMTGALVPVDGGTLAD
jgi:NAD(P)-dependent dehydrogenase (short-subunit alcohol dehydrogenase family)